MSSEESKKPYSKKRMNLAIENVVALRADAFWINLLMIHVLIEYMAKERVRTYIKDGVLNAYAKSLTQKALASATPEKIIHDIFEETAAIIQEGKGKQNGLYVLRAESGSIYVLSSGTVLKWETALRKALDIIANEPNLTINNKAPSICLRLSTSGQSLTVADKIHIVAALGAVGVNAVFCGL